MIQPCQVKEAAMPRTLPSIRILVSILDEAARFFALVSDGKQAADGNVCSDLLAFQIPALWCERACLCRFLKLQAANLRSRVRASSSGDRKAVQVGELGLIFASACESNLVPERCTLARVAFGRAGAVSCRTAPNLQLCEPFKPQ